MSPKYQDETFKTSPKKLRQSPSLDQESQHFIQSRNNIAKDRPSSVPAKKRVQSNPYICTPQIKKRHAEESNNMKRLRQEVALEEEKELTFRPKINKNYPFNRKLEANVPRVFFCRLHSWGNQKYLKQKILIMQKKTEEEQKEKEVRLQHKRRPSEPSKRQKQNRFHSLTSPESKLPVYERLLELEKKRIQKIAKVKERLEEKEMEELQFCPTTTNYELKKQIVKPIWERVDNINKTKQRLHTELKHKLNKERQRDFTFKPQISNKSKQLAQVTYFFIVHFSD
ncbi:hypothetical protein RFI_08078 [Reticulomyxa filosa]|uniref:Uncharacterized protein n=1 Tax=Reticulomyxa filosa TaxID=46433 RepID=X6NUV4_RETFI|nr:hypothetical protein RFI_08078 [Reticulomyxa filosa]|eukprot:ETO29047.1 hypothetical protein RFI_08078 [Reticulomyxa filosa]